MGFVDIIVQYENFESSIGNIEKATWVFNCLSRPGHFWQYWKKMGKFWGTFFHFFRDKKYLKILNSIASALKRCIISLFFEKKIESFLNFLTQNRLCHTQLNVCEKKELPCFLYLIQIFRQYGAKNDLKMAEIA